MASLKFIGKCVLRLIQLKPLPSRKSSSQAEEGSISSKDTEARDEERDEDEDRKDTIGEILVGGDKLSDYQQEEGQLQIDTNGKDRPVLSMLSENEEIAENPSDISAEIINQPDLGESLQQDLNSPSAAGSSSDFETCSPHSGQEGENISAKTQEAGNGSSDERKTEELGDGTLADTSDHSRWMESLIAQTSHEVWLVVEDFTASNPQELSVQKGQQVELLELSPSGNTEWCLVRLVTTDTSVDPIQGLVPMATLKQVPNLRVSHTSASGAVLDTEESTVQASDPSPNTSNYSLNSSGSNTSNAASPANKRRGSSFRKWLTTPVRKLSQTKIDKTVTDKVALTAEMHKGKQERKGGQLFKERSDTSTGQVEAGPVSPVTKQPEAQLETAQVNGEEVEEAAPDIELPPPMPQLKQPLATSSTSTEEVGGSKKSSTHSLPREPSGEGATNSMDLAAEMENIVRQRMQTEFSEDRQSSEQGEDEGAVPEGEEEEGFTIGEGEGEEETPAEEAPVEEAGGDETTGDDSLSAEEKTRQRQVQKRQFILQELLETERDYVKDLGNVVEGYMEIMKETPPPEDMEGKDKIVFGNIQQIFEWHRDTFSKEIEKSIEDPTKLAKAFIRYERRLQMYVKYCENKPKSEYIVAEYIDSYFEDLRVKLNQRLKLPDLLIKPVQRIMKYQLMLKDILKCTERAGEDTRELVQAVQVMCRVPKDANDMMSVGRLQGFDGKITAQGRLRLQGDLLVMDQGSKVKPEQQKFRNRHVFLFEQIIIFSEEEKRRNIHANPRFIFKASIQVNKMSLNEKGTGDPLTFTLVDKTPGSDMKYVCQAADEAVKAEWLEQLNSLLNMLGDFFRAIQSPIAYQNELKKELSAPEFGGACSVKNSLLRKTHSQPQPQKVVAPPSAQAKKETKDSPKHSRTKSVPNDSKNKCTDGKHCPASPNKSATLEKSKSDCKRSGSPKPKKTSVFEGFRNTLRSKGKSDNSRTTSVSGASVNEPPGQESEFGGPATPGASSLGGTFGKKTKKQGSSDSSEADNSPVEGSFAKVTQDYNAVKEDEISVVRGENVQVLGANQHGMMLVHRPANELSPAAEGWVPMSILMQDDSRTAQRKSWHLKIRRPSFKNERKEKEVNSTSLDRNYGNKGRPSAMYYSANPEFTYESAPSFQIELTNRVARVGETARFTCRVCGRPKPTVTWKGPDDRILIAGPGVNFSYLEDGTAILQLNQVTVDQTGEYTCVATNNLSCVTSTATLVVVLPDHQGAPGHPVVREQTGNCVHLEWMPPPTLDGSGVLTYTLEYIENGIGDWQQAVTHIPGTSHILEELAPGAHYLFRVVAHMLTGEGRPSESSDVIIMPSDAELTAGEESGVVWKTNFSQDYLVTTEIARGRFAIVKKCTQICSGQEVACKFISKKLVGRGNTETEFNMMQSLQHPGLVEVFDLYDTGPYHVIIMELLPSGRLFDFICHKAHFDEVQAAGYVAQLLDVVQFLHNCRVAHLDIKPENLMVDLTQISPRLKLCDLGDACHIYSQFYVHPLVGSPEFAAPEVISGQPIGTLTDIWSIGVIVYVMLSGISPFLDESTEETCCNILRRDFCFPEEYFCGVSQEAKDFISLLLVYNLSDRRSASDCLQDSWIQRAVGRATPSRAKPLSTVRLRDFIERRSHQNDTGIVSPLQLPLSSS